MELIEIRYTKLRFLGEYSSCDVDGFRRLSFSIIRAAANAIVAKNMSKFQYVLFEINHFHVVIIQFLIIRHIHRLHLTMFLTVNEINPSKPSHIHHHHLNSVTDYTKTINFQMKLFKIAR